MKVEMLLKAKNIFDETIAPNNEVGEDKECYCVLEEFHPETLPSKTLFPPSSKKPKKLNPPDHYKVPY